MRRLIEKFNVPEEPKNVHAFDVINYRMSDGVDKGLTIAIFEGIDDSIRGVEFCISLRDRDIQIIGVRNIEFATPVGG